MAANLTEILTRTPAFLLGLSLHEWGHAYVADRAGDPTPRSQGRVSLNPLRHLDPLGTLCIVFAPIGWGKPVQIQPGNFLYPLRDSLRVSLAGPWINLILCALALLSLQEAPYWLPLLPQVTVVPVVLGLQALMDINLALAIFNLLPVPPLDGSNVLFSLLSPQWRQKYAALRPYGVPLLLGLVSFGALDSTFIMGFRTLGALARSGGGATVLVLAFLGAVWLWIRGEDRSQDPGRRPLSELKPLLR